MTTVERILVRWITALAAGVNAVALAVNTLSSLSDTLIIIVLVANLFLGAVVASLTTENGQRLLGTSKPRD